MSDSLQLHGLWPTRLLCPWTFPGKSTGMGCHFLLQGIFSSQGSKLRLLHCRQTLYRLSHCQASVQFSSVPQSCPTLCDPMDCSLPGSSVHGLFQARVLEWVAISFSRGSFQSRDRTQSPALQADSLLSERLMKPNSYAVSLFPAISLLLKLIWQMKFKCKTNPNRHILITSNT